MVSTLTDPPIINVQASGLIKVSESAKRLVGWDGHKVLVIFFIDEFCGVRDVPGFAFMKPSDGTQDFYMSPLMADMVFGFAGISDPLASPVGGITAELSTYPVIATYNGEDTAMYPILPSTLEVIADEPIY